MSLFDSFQDPNMMGMQDMVMQDPNMYGLQSGMSYPDPNMMGMPNPNMIGMQDPSMMGMANPNMMAMQDPNMMGMQNQFNPMYNMPSQAMIPQTPIMGRVDKYGMVHYTKAQILDGLRNYVIANTGRQITREEKLEETPQLLRHACAEAKITNLPLSNFYVAEMNVSVPFYFCQACGKLFYLKDFM